jgi:hypothetical protein
LNFGAVGSLNLASCNEKAESATVLLRDTQLGTLGRRLHIVFFSECVIVGVCCSGDEMRWT